MCSSSFGMQSTDSPGVLVASEKIQHRVRELATEVNVVYGRDRELHLVAVLTGAFVFLVDLMRALARPVTVDFVAVSSYDGGTESSRHPQLVKDLTHPIQGRDVLVVEDIVDTGHTLNWLLRQLGGRGPQSLRTIALLDKRARREAEVPIDHVGFTIDDQFVVGYGLDYAGRYRHLPYIGVLDEADDSTPC